MEIENTEDIIDSRDIIKRIDELKDEIDYLGKELDELINLRDQGEDYVSDWKYGVTLISEHYFTGYCEELISDTEPGLSELPWYVRDCIDWDGVAKNIMVDYTAIDFNGTTYYVR